MKEVIFTAAPSEFLLIARVVELALAKITTMKSTTNKMLSWFVNTYKSSLCSKKLETEW